jgi:acetyltransferase
LFRLVIAENWHPQIVTPTGIDGEEILWLRKGESISIRPIRPDDAPRLQAFIAQLSQAAIYDRFMGYKKTLPDEEARQLASLDYDHQMALVATKSKAHGEESILGVAHYYVLEDDPSCAEFAVVIGDAYQRQGLGTHLMMRLMEYAQAHGIHTLIGYALPENFQLLRFVQRSGLPIQRKLKDGLWEIRLQLEGIDFPEAEKLALSHTDKHHEHKHSERASPV